MVYNNPTEPLGSLAFLRELSPADIGRRLLPHALAQNANAGVVPRDFAGSLSRRYRPPEQDEVELLVMEGVSWAIRTGLLIENPKQMNGRFYLLSREGRRAAAAPDAVSASSAGAEARTLIHPRIAAAALHQYERGADSYTQAVAIAFGELEAAVRERARALGHPISAGTVGKDVFYEAVGAKNEKRGVLTPNVMHPGEANALKELFAGAFGALRNPASHHLVRHEDSNETMRLLIVASALLAILERLPPETSRVSDAG